MHPADEITIAVGNGRIEKALITAKQLITDHELNDYGKKVDDLHTTLHALDEHEMMQTMTISEIDRGRSVIKKALLAMAGALKDELPDLKTED